MKRRIIINIEEDEITDAHAISLVAAVVDKGRVSESRGRKHYCHVSTTALGTVIYATKGSDSTDTFKIWTGNK